MNYLFSKFCFLKSRRGNANLVSLLLLSLAIAAVAVFGLRTMKDRNSELRRVEFEMAKSQLERNLNSVYNDPTFLNEIVLKANETTSLWEKESIQKLKNNNFIFPIATTKANLASDEMSPWIGEGVTLTYPWLKPCPRNLSCPLQVKLKSVQASAMTIEFQLEVLTRDVSQTGPLNSSKAENQIKLRIDRGIEGLVLNDAQIYCEKGFALQYFHTPPLSLRCRPVGGQP